MLEVETFALSLMWGLLFVVQVYEEKRQNYAMELKEIHDEWSRRFRDHQQKAFKNWTGSSATGIEVNNVRSIHQLEYLVNNLKSITL